MEQQKKVSFLMDTDLYDSLGDKAENECLSLSAYLRMLISNELRKDEQTMTNYGEEMAYQYLTDNGYQVEDVSENKDYFAKDIDFIATKEGKSHPIEVKWDNRIHQTGNMFIETSSNLEKGKDGWALFCEAEYLYYGDSANKIFYIIKMDDLKDYLQNNVLQERNAADYSYNGKLRKRSRGAIVPINEFSSKYQVNIAYV